ncbi:ATP-binding cassette domain-containing protein [Mangrovihabitans endophyticus]|uniref:Sugar ABC transporter ATP-binding protein n=1 Tax=Mangrovihabitans endophyticus TaxID=1751298 RepID=A0A8J3FMG3_9ACTN|nr:sugar ABC transporter ATP-binding protein [Mangrovihabitans endophyticus]GGK75831.1 sugar ABC transporter ATP-binding protein [Mangrovihabitans endophyticus]
MNPGASAPRLSLSGVSVAYRRNRVLHDVGFAVGPAEIHALIGQNGSGKSTLVKVLTGLCTAEPGACVEIDGVPLRLPARLADVRAAGVAVVHQSLGLVPQMSVLENMRIGRLRARRFSRRIRWDRERAAAGRMFDRLGRHVPLDVAVHRLSEEDRATVAIARALQDTPHGGGLIVFDESTRALSRRSLEHFYEVLDDVVRAGTSALLISHRLEEVAEVADRVTVLRDGKLVEAGRAARRGSEGELARLMLGRALQAISSGGGHARPHAEPAVELADVIATRLDGAAVRVAPGEIVGLTGLADSGYDQVPYVLAGVERAASGKLLVNGDHIDLDRFTPAAALGAGVALVPGDRERAGLASGQTVAENAALPRTGTAGPRLSPIRRRAELAELIPWLDRLRLHPPDPHAVVGRLSGGNQQKVVLAKWLSRGLRLLVLHEPTQAVDVGARAVIVDAVKDAAASGCGVLVAGSDENELSMLCDRVLVFRDGRVHRELAGPCRPEVIVAAVFASSQRRPLRANREERVCP